MKLLAIKFFNRHGFKALRLSTSNILRNSSTCESSGNKGESCSDQKSNKPTDASSKKDCAAPPPPPPPPPPPICSETPSSMSSDAYRSSCPPIVDPNNPCNYVPPVCKDPTKPNMTKIKKMQCEMQRNMSLPVYLIKGSSDAILYRITLALTIYCTLVTIYTMMKVIRK